MEGYEPIVFRNGRFLLQDAAGASQAGGESNGVRSCGIYTAFYGKRLPTEVGLAPCSKSGEKLVQASS